jgi:branched-chain amino acid transport system substrate-binding protein
MNSDTPFARRDVVRSALTARRTSWPRRFLAIAAVASLACLMTACASKTTNASGTTASSGFTGGEVRLASTYPTSLVGADNMLGVQAYFNYINTTQGGVKMADGKKYKLDFKYLDDGYDTGRAVSNVKNLLATYHPAAFLFLLGSAINEATIDQLDAAGVPDIYSSEGDDLWQDNIGKYPMFGPTGDPSDNLWMASQLDYVKTTWPGAKIALLAQNDAYGQDIQKALAKDITGTGLTLAATQLYNTGAPSVSTQVAKLASSGATVFFDTSLAPALTQSIKYMKTIGWNVPHFICYSCANSTVVGPAGDAADGIYAPLVNIDPSIPQWSDSTAVSTLKGILTKYGPAGTTTSATTLDGAAIAQLMVENLEASQPTSVSLLNTVRNQHGTADPLLLPGTSVTTSPTYPYYVNQLTVGQYSVASNSWNLVGKPYVDPTFQS